MKPRYKYAITLALCALVTLVRAYPVTEKTPANSSAPLSVLSSQPDKMFLPTYGDFKDKYIFVPGSSSLGMISTETWDDVANPPDAFSTTVVDVTLLGNGTSLVMALSNGNLARIELDDETSFVPEEVEEEESSDESDNDTSDEDDSDDSDNDTSSDDEEEEETELADSREINSSEGMTSAGLTHIVANPESDADYVYMMDGDGGYYFEFNLDNEALSEVAITDTATEEESTDSTDETTDDTTTTSATLTDMVYANSNSGDKVLICTDAGEMIVMTPKSGGDFATITLSARDENDETPSFSDMALTSDHDYAFVVDTANDAVWVFSVGTEEFVDQTSGGTSLDPVEFDSSSENATITQVGVYYDTTELKDYAYVSGSLGLSLIDAGEPGNRAEEKLKDGDLSDTGDYDPIALAGTPGPLAVSSPEDGYIFSANGDATISVLTDNPWVTVSSISTEKVTALASTFTVTFQTDTAGVYTVRANSNPAGSAGTELISETAVDTVDNDVTTATLDINDFDREVFMEGDNLIHVFVTDVDGLTGRDAIKLAVDRPPGELDITSVNFGDEKAYIFFNQSEDDDIASYTAYAEPATSQTAPTCPGTLQFSSAGVVSSTFDATACKGDPCEGQVTGLTNDTVYCMAVRATDEAGQAGTLTAYTSSVTPEETVGPAGFLGETGCRLQRHDQPYDSRPAWFMLGLFLCLCTCMRTFRYRGGLCRCPDVGGGCADVPMCRCRRKGGSTAIRGFVIMLLLAVGATPARAAETFGLDPKRWTFETRLSMWMPTRPAVTNFFSICCNPLGELEFGYIHDNRYNPTIAVGLTYLSGNARGRNNGLPSGDRFTLAMIPVRAAFNYRIVWREDQLIVPFVRAGIDAVLFRESEDDSTIQGVKFGLHGAGGLAILLDKLDGSSSFDSSDSGINDVYLTLEGRYAYINSFNATGLDLSGIYPYVGVLFEF